MKHRKFGYICVSSKDQHEDCQLEAMRKMGINERDIYLNKQSGKNFARANYQLLKRVIRKGDILYFSLVCPQFLFQMSLYNFIENGKPKSQ